MIEYQAGDLFESKEEYIAQGVAEGNQEGLGTGLALAVSRRWPDVQSAFKKHARSGRFTGGEIWSCPPAAGRPGVVYLATQPDMYHATVPYLRKSLRKLARWADKEGVESVGLPKIAAGLGKLDWEEVVRPLFVAYLSDQKCRFIVYEHYRQDHPG